MAEKTSAAVDLSVVLTTKNGAAKIGVQLDALARQTWHGDWEVVVSDNGSTDATLEIVESYRSRVPSLRTVVSAAVAGAAHAYNTGAQAAKGSMLAFCNDDDEVADGWLRAMAEGIERHGFVAGRLEHDHFNEPWMVAIRGRPQDEGLMSWPHGEYFRYGFACTLGVRHELHQRIGGFDEDLFAGEDVDYCWRLQRLGVELHFVPTAVTHYRFRRSLRATFSQARVYGEANTRVYKKHRALGLPRAPRPLMTGVRKWLGLAKLLALAWSKERRGRAAWHLGLRTGMLVGSVRHRVLLL